MSVDPSFQRPDIVERQEIKDRQEYGDFKAVPRNGDADGSRIPDAGSCGSLGIFRTA